MEDLNDRQVQAANWKRLWTGWLVDREMNGMIN
jgi:hypothetical protein